MFFNNYTDSTDNCYENTNEKQLSLRIFLNLKKAFHPFKHRIWGIAGADCKRVSEINNSIVPQMVLRKGIGTVICGVPQGSWIDPILFAIYLNDFASCIIDSKAGLYADDTLLRKYQLMLKI